MALPSRNRRLHDRHATPTPVVESLERRDVLSAVFPTNLEQYLVELVNRARADPTGEAARYGITLNEGVAAADTISTAAKQPLAINPNLTDSARKHSQWMIDNDVFSHYEGPNNTIDPGSRITAAGYSLTGNWTWGENIAWRGSTPTVPNPLTTTAQLHQDLFVDSTVAGRGHRLNILAPAFREIGGGLVSGAFLSNGTNWNAVMGTEDFATNSGNAAGDAFLTGVAYADTTTADKFYTPGEGLGGVTVTATRTSDNAAFTTTTWSAGGYSLRLIPGTYTVAATGGGLAGAIKYLNVTVGTDNVKRDFVSGGPAAVQAVQLNDGNAQRSMIKTLTVTFDRSVVPDAGAFALVGRNGAGAGTVVAAANPTGDGATWVLSFSGSPVVGGSLADGIYDLTVVASKVHSGTAAGPAMAADYGFKFHRLYSDADGDGDSDNFDLLQLRPTLLKPSTDPAYRWYFDYDASGTVDNLDVFQVRSRRGVVFQGY